MHIIYVKLFIEIAGYPEKHRKGTQVGVLVEAVTIITNLGVAQPLDVMDMWFQML